MTSRQVRFIHEFVRLRNGTAAAIASGYSRRTAQEQGSRLLSNAMVSAAIKERLAAQLETIDASAEHIAQELAATAFARPRGAPRYADKLKALELLGRWRGMFTDKPEIVEREIVGDLSALSDEEVDTLARIAEKAGVRPYCSKTARRSRWS